MCSSTLSSSTVCTISLLKYHFVCPAFGSESSLFLTQFHNSFPSYIPVAQISASQILFFMVFFIYVMAYTLVYFFSEFFSRIWYAVLFNIFLFLSQYLSHLPCDPMFIISIIFAHGLLALRRFILCIDNFIEHQLWHSLSTFQFYLVTPTLVSM